MSKIIKAGIKYNGSIYTGFDHGECFKKLPKEANASNCEQGFIDENNSFYDRKQAMKIAKENNQLNFVYDKSNLISEDLHLNWLNIQEQKILEQDRKIEELESEHLLSEVEWQDYCSYKRIEPQIKGCLDREKQLTERLNEYETLMKKHNIESIYKLDACLSDYLDVNSDTMAGKIIKQQKELLIAKNNEIKRLKAMKGRENLIAENEALKDTIAVVLAQKRNSLKNNEELRNKLHTLPKEIVEKIIDNIHKYELIGDDFAFVKMADIDKVFQQFLKEYGENSDVKN